MTSPVKRTNRSGIPSAFSENSSDDTSPNGTASPGVNPETARMRSFLQSKMAELEEKYPDGVPEAPFMSTGRKLDLFVIVTLLMILATYLYAVEGVPVHEVLFRFVTRLFDPGQIQKATKNDL